MMGEILAQNRRKETLNEEGGQQGAHQRPPRARGRDQGGAQADLHDTRAQDGEVLCWQLTEEPSSVALRGHAGPLLSAAFSPDGRSVVAASEQTPSDAKIDPWFRFEARLALTVLDALPPASMSDVDEALTRLSRVLEKLHRLSTALPTAEFLSS